MQMIGILSYGAYVPYNRLKRDVFKAAYGTGGKGEKAVANYDEDSLTMGVSASLEALKNFDNREIDSVFFATTTSPYDEKGCAATIATALDVPRHARTADITTSLRSGNIAMMMALDGAAQGRNSIVSVADCRLGAPNGSLESDLGDAGAAFVIGQGENVVAKYVDSVSTFMDISDYWRANGAKHVSSWEERFGITQGYNKIVYSTVTELMEKTGTQPSDYAKIVLFAHRERYAKAMATKLGFTPEQLQDSLYTTVGNSGTAYGPLGLVAALEDAKPGDKLMMVTWGDGCDAVVFEVTDKITELKVKTGVQKYLVNKKNDMNYEKYLLWKEAMTFEPGRRPPFERASQPMYFRDQMKNLPLYGSKCTECGEVAFPMTKVCAKCNSMNKTEPYRIYGHKGKIVTFTCDFLSTIPDLPEITAVIDFEGGGRMVCNLVDSDYKTLKAGMEVEMVFRKVTTSAGIGIYHWKSSLVHSKEAIENETNN